MRVLPLLLAAIVALPATAAEKLYKWTDDEGVTHYSDAPPEGRQFEAREIDVDPAPPPAEELPDAASLSETAAEAGGANAGQNCQRVRGNLETLQASETVQMDLDGDGQPERLTPEQREQQIDLAERQIAAYCG